MTKTKFEIGNIVITLVDKTQSTLSGPTKCPKGTKGVICSMGENYVTLDVSGSLTTYDTFDFAFDEVELIKA